MTATAAGVHDLKRQFPEWQPWLSVVEQALAETANPRWQSLVPDCPRLRDKTPFLAEARLHPDDKLIHAYFQRLIRAAAASAASNLAALAVALHADLDMPALFRAAVGNDSDLLRREAAAFGGDGAPFEALAGLLAVPFLQACNRAWAQVIPANWAEGYCPVCGAWPAFGEVLGIERSRYLRCGRCGAAWQAHCLFCPYCGTTAHGELTSLVPEKNTANAAIEACQHCLGYVKTLTKLQPAAPENVMYDDLATVELDVAALSQGYRRPPGSGYSLNVAI